MSDLHAGNVEPSQKIYKVTFAHDHKTLVVGDVVVMIEAPDLKNWLIRLPDFTCHKLSDEADQYVHLSETSCINTNQ